MADIDEPNNNRDLLEEQSRSLEELVAEMRQQSANVVDSVDSNVDVERSIRALEGTLGVDANENTAALRENFATANAIMQEQVALQEAGLPFDQELLNSAQDQLEMIQAGVKSEEDRREAIKKQDEANSLLGKVVGKLDSVGGKVKESGGFLAGIAGLATLILNPQAFANGLQAVLGFVGDMVSVVENVFAGDFESAANLLAENGGIIAGVLGFLLVSNIGKIIKGVNMLLKGFKILRVFMLGTMIPGMLAAFAGMKVAMISMLAPFAPVLLVAAKIALVVGAILLALEGLRRILGFESIFDVISLGFSYLKDAFAGIGNFFINLGKKIGEMIGGLAGIFGFEVPEFAKNLADMELLDTNNAANKKVELKEKARLAEEERQKEAEAEKNKKANEEAQFGGLGIDTSEFDTDNLEIPAPQATVEVPPELEEQRVFKDSAKQERGPKILERKEPVQQVEKIVQQAPVVTGQEIFEKSAENLLANLPATTENNVVNQVQTTSTNNSGNKQTTVIQGYRPSRLGQYVSTGFSGFFR